MRKMYAVGVAPLVAYDLGLAPPGIHTCLRHTAHCNGLQSGSRISPSYMNEPVWFTESPWFVLKSVHWAHGQLQDYGPKDTKECTTVRDYSPVGSAS